MNVYVFDTLYLASSILESTGITIRPITALNLEREQGEIITLGTYI